MSIILSLCDYSGIWPAPYKEAGYEVIQVDLKHGWDARLWPSPVSPEPRVSSELNDIRDYQGRIHGILAAPVCTVFSNAGSRIPRSDEALKSALALVDACVRLAWVLKPEWWALENPIGKVPKWLGAPVMRFHPCHYGDPYKKLTQLWGDFNTDLPLTHVEPEIVCKQGSWVQQLGGSSERTKELRSMTPPGFARAFFEANP